MKKEESEKIDKFIIGLAIGVMFLVAFFGFVGGFGYLGLAEDEDYGDSNTNTNSEERDTQEIYDEYVETGEVDWEEVYGDDWEGFIERKLEEEGYKVIDVSVMDITSIDPISIPFGDTDYAIGKRKIRVEMESLGNRADQIKQVIFKSALIENKYGFWIEIHETTYTCTYVIRWEDWVTCLDNYCDINTFLLEDSLLICR